MKNSLNKSLVWMTVTLLLLAGCAGTRTQQSTGEYIDAQATDFFVGQQGGFYLGGDGSVIDVLTGTLLCPCTRASRQHQQHYRHPHKTFIQRIFHCWVLFLNGITGYKPGKILCERDNVASSEPSNQGR